MSHLLRKRKFQYTELIVVRRVNFNIRGIALSGNIDWQVFDYKFRNNKQKMFELLSFKIFSWLFLKKEEGPTLYYDKDLEPNIIEYEGKKISFEARYFEASVLNARFFNDIETGLTDLSNRLPLDIIIVFTNCSLPQSPKKENPKTIAQIHLEKRAEELGFEIRWMPRADIDRILKQSSMSNLCSFFFELEGVCDSEYWRTTNTLYKYMRLEKLEESIKNGVPTTCLGMSNPFELEGVKNPDLYRKCCMTNSPRQMLLWAYYGHHRGCCVEYDVSGVDQILLRKVEYTSLLSKHEDMTPKEVCEDLYKMGKEWAHENEYRAVFYKRNYDSTIWNVIGEDVYLKAKVKSVMLGLYASENTNLYVESLELLKKHNIAVKKCRIKPEKYEITEDPQFDIESELDKGKDSKHELRTREDKRMSIVNYGTWIGDAVEGNKIVNNTLSEEEKHILKSCIKENNISKDDIGAIVSVLKDINQSQNDLVTEYAYMASETRNGEKSRSIKKLQEKVTFSNSVVSLIKMIGDTASKHPEAIKDIAGFLETTLL